MFKNYAKPTGGFEEPRFIRSKISIAQEGGGQRPVKKEKQDLA
jgi:hypothetical protein